MQKIEKIVALSAGTQAQTVRVNGLACLIQNNSTVEVYFKERRDDGADVTPDNGWLLSPGTETAIPLAARELSVAAREDGADVRVLILDEA